MRNLATNYLLLQFSSTCHSQPYNLFATQLDTDDWVYSLETTSPKKINKTSNNGELNDRAVKRKYVYGECNVGWWDCAKKCQSWIRPQNFFTMHCSTPTRWQPHTASCLLAHFILFKRLVEWSWEFGEINIAASEMMIKWWESEKRLSSNGRKRWYIWSHNLWALTRPETVEH